MDLPEKLTPIPGLDRSMLPAWIKDCGIRPACDELPETIVMTTVKPDGELLHVSGVAEAFDETFWVRYAEPMVNCLGSALFEAEHPGKTMPSFHWDAASFYGDPLTEEQKAIIARRKELTWTSPIRVFPDQD